MRTHNSRCQKQYEALNRFHHVGRINILPIQSNRLSTVYFSISWYFYVYLCLIIAHVSTQELM